MSNDLQGLHHGPTCFNKTNPRLRETSLVFHISLFCSVQKTKPSSQQAIQSASQPVSQLARQPGALSGRQAGSQSASKASSQRQLVSHLARLPPSEPSSQPESLLAKQTAS